MVGWCLFYCYVGLMLLSEYMIDKHICPPRRELRIVLSPAAISRSPPCYPAAPTAYASQAQACRLRLCNVHIHSRLTGHLASPWREKRKMRIFCLPPPTCRHFLHLKPSLGRLDATLKISTRSHCLFSSYKQTTGRQSHEQNYYIKLILIDCYR